MKLLLVDVLWDISYTLKEVFTPVLSPSWDLLSGAIVILPWWSTIKSESDAGVCGANAKQLCSAYKGTGLLI